jgi:hypothetical protein
MALDWMHRLVMVRPLLALVLLLERTMLLLLLDPTPQLDQTISTSPHSGTFLHRDTLSSC